MTTPPEIQPTDPVARHQAVRVWLLAALAGGITIMAARSWFDDLPGFLAEHADTLFANPAIGAVAGLLLVLPVIVGAVFVWRFAARVRASGQIPPPGHRNIKPTRVYRGKQALWRARVIQMLSVVLIVCALALPVMLWMLLGSLAR